MLTGDDRKLLDDLGLAWSAVPEGGWVTLIISAWPLPAGYDRRSSDLMLRVPPGYPDMPLDMWYFAPAVSHADGTTIEQTQVREHFSGRDWQRWSRHLNPGDWQPGVDSLESYLARLRAELVKTVSRVTA